MKELTEKMIALFKDIEESKSVNIKYRTQANNISCELLKFKLMIMTDEMRVSNPDLIKELEQFEYFNSLNL